MPLRDIIDERFSQFQPRAALLRCLNGLGIVIVLTMVVIGALILAGVRRDAWRQASQASDMLVQRFERDIAHNIDVFDVSIRGVLAALAEPGIDRVDPAIRYHALFDRAAAARDLGAIAIVNAAGDVVEDSVSNPPRKINVADRAYFRFQREHGNGGLYISGPFLSRSADGDLRIAFSRPLPMVDGTFRGLVQGTLRLSFFRRLFEQQAGDQAAAVTLFRTDGRLIARQPFRADAIDVDYGPSEDFQAFGDQQGGAFVGKGLFDNTERLYAYRRVGNYPLVLAVGIATSDIASAWRTKALVIGAVLLLLCAATAAAFLLFRREMDRRTSAGRALTTAVAKLAALATTDSLTGLANRLSFETAFNREWVRAADAGSSIALLLLDIDHFKLFNDRFGHQNGDQVLRSVSRCLGASIGRTCDLVARYGGEEFLVMMPDTDLDTACQAAERIRRAVEALPIVHVEPSGGRVTVSIGVAATRPQADEPAELLLKRADQALYAAKRAGRNRVHTMPGGIETEPVASPGLPLASVA